MRAAYLLGVLCTSYWALFMSFQAWAGLEVQTIMPCDKTGNVAHSAPSQAQLLGEIKRAVEAGSQKVKLGPQQLSYIQRQRSLFASVPSETLISAIGLGDQAFAESVERAYSGYDVRVGSERFETLIRELGTPIPRLQKLAGIYRIQADPLMVGGDIPVGGLGTLPFNSQVVMRNGRDCHEPANGADFWGAGDNDSAFLVDLRGYQEVVALVNPGRKDAMCSGVVIGTRYVLTAGHCVSELASTDVAIPKTSATSAQLATEVDFSNCTQDCPYEKWSMNVLRPQQQNFDIALLVAQTDLPVARAGKNQILSPTIPLNSLPATNRGEQPKHIFTLAGYGIPNRRQLNVGRWWPGVILEGNQVKPAVVSKDGRLQLFHAPDSNSSKICRFDSGGPVYEGYDNGSTVEPSRSRRLIGLTQGGDANIASSINCKSSNYQFVELLEPAVQWICSREPRPESCPANK
jgi:hypothetical protein